MLIQFTGRGGPIALDPTRIAEVVPNPGMSGWSYVIVHGGNEYPVQGTPPDIMRQVNEGCLKQKIARARPDEADMGDLA